MTNLGNEEKKKEFKEGDLRFALNLFRKKRLSSKRFKELMFSSGDPKLFVRRFNKETNYSYSPAVKAYSELEGIKSDDFYAYGRLKKLNPKGELKVKKARTLEARLNEEIVHSANIVGLLGNKELRKELSGDIKGYNWRKIVAMLDYQKNPGSYSRKRSRFRNKAEEIYGKLFKKRRRRK